MNDSVKTLLYKTIHRNAKPAAQLADEIGISYSYLCRAGLPTDESGVRFPLELVVPLMKSAGEYSLLRHLAMLCGFLLVKAPRGFRDRSDEVETVNNYNKLCAITSSHLMEFFKTPSPLLIEKTTESLRSVMEYSAALQKRISDYNQMELSL